MFKRWREFFRKKSSGNESPAPVALSAEGIVLSHLDQPSNQWLIPLSSADEILIRTNQEIYQRLIALWAVVGFAKDPEDTYFREYIDSNGFREWLSPREQKFLYSESHTERDEIQFSWQAECLVILCWATRIIDEIHIPSKSFADYSFIEHFPGCNDEVGHLLNFIDLRPKDELLRWSDLIMHAHWMVRDASRSGHERICRDTIQEWHHAINWLVYLAEEPQDWDDVTTDT